MSEILEIKSSDELPKIDDNINTPYSFEIEANTYNCLSYDDFFNNHMRKNIPCIIKNIGANWDSTKKWVKNDGINYDFLDNKYGNLIVPVTDCKNITFDYQPRSEMKLSDYLHYLKDNVRDKMLYLKDWHLRRSKPNDPFYIVPLVFASDWLNEYAHDKQKDDFMFVYMGPKGSWTPLHADVYSSFSWSVNVTGRKKWLLFPPGEEEKLKDKFNNVVLQFEPEKHKDKNVVYYEIIQDKGDAIFVPSNWYHQVENEKDTISVNHNWVNGCNIQAVWQSLTKVLTSVEKEIEDLKDLPDFKSMCQNLLKNLFGMDYEGFASLVVYITQKRLAQLEGGTDISFDYKVLGRNHCMYDLKCLNDVILKMLDNPIFAEDLLTISDNLFLLQDTLTYVLH